jgi:hypothetical protein
LRPLCKVLAINWGPWDGGMVTAGLKQNFISNGIPLIPVHAGAKAMVDEMALGENGPVEVVVGGPLPSAAAVLEKEEQKPQEEELANMATLDIDVHQYPVLNSHMLDGRPVVPLAIITEWLAHGALHANPGLALHGLDGLRVFNGITLEKGQATISMMAGKARRVGNHYNVKVELRNQVDGSTPRKIHSSATVVLTDAIPVPPVFNENGHFKTGGFARTMEEVYGDTLFHGEDLRGIREIIRVSEEGISARIAAAPPPARWMTAPLRSRWIADPLVLDSAFQMAIVWCKENFGKVSLPSYAASYRQYTRRFPKEGVSAVLEVQTCDERKMVGDFTFLDPKKHVVARLNGYEAIMDPLLADAFKAA